MKQKVSVTIEDTVLQRVDQMLADGTFRNKSHIIELALRKFLEQRK